MESRIDILNELKELSPLIAGMEKLNVFTVPPGYFEGFGEYVMRIVKAEETGILTDLSKQSSFQVPAGYFDGLADTIMAKIKAGQHENAADELRGLSPMLYSIQHENVFEVPKGYFAGLAATILNKAQQNKNAAQELRELSPMLYSIQNENVFEVPKGYFTGLSDTILSKVQPVKVVTMRRRSTTFMKYAVAAVFTGMMALGVFKFTDTSNNYVDPAVAEGLKIANENRFDEEFAKVSDADIVKYLETSGSDVNAALVANTANNSVDENDLPSQADYMMDEKALDKYLDNINVNSPKN